MESSLIGAFVYCASFCFILSTPFNGKGQSGRGVADHIVDVLNNGIRMSIAEAKPNLSTKDLAQLGVKVLLSDIPLQGVGSNPATRGREQQLYDCYRLKG